MRWEIIGWERVLSGKRGLGMGGNGQTSWQGYIQATLHLQKWTCPGNRTKLSLSKRTAGEKREESKESWGFQLLSWGWDSLSDKITCDKFPEGAPFTQGSPALGCWRILLVPPQLLLRLGKHFGLREIRPCTRRRNVKVWMGNSPQSQHFQEMGMCDPMSSAWWHPGPKTQTS